MKKILLILGLFLILVGCGVKGKPLPPLKKNETLKKVLAP